VSRTKRASTRFEPAPADPFAGNLDPTTPWAVLPSTLAAISQFMRRGVSAELLAEHSKDPVPNAQVRGARTAGGGAGVAILSLRGLITPRSSFLSLLFGGGGGLESFRATLREALADDDIAAILLDIDSPGGSGSLVPETAAEIRAARGTKPIVAIANTLAASAAYWIATQADELVVTPSGFVGSVGTYALHEDWSSFNEQFGVDPTYVFAGRYKIEGNENEPLSETARNAWQETVDQFQAMFVTDVALGRGVDEQTVLDDYGEGRVLTAPDALQAGMVDRVEPFEDTLARLVAGDTPAAGGASAATGARLLNDQVAPPAPSSTTPPADREVAPAAQPSWLLPAPRRH
jgi:signal peptide peptidase SppA